MPSTQSLTQSAAALAALLLLAPIAPAAAQGAFEEDGRRYFNDPAKGGCVTCHGREGRQPINPLYPKLAGQNERYLLQQMLDIKSGERSNGLSGIMRGMMNRVSEQELEAIAAYLASLD